MPRKQGRQPATLNRELTKQNHHGVNVYLNETQIDMVNNLLRRGTWGNLPVRVVERLLDNALQQQFPQGLPTTAQ